MTLIGQHGLSIDQRLIVVLVVQSRGSGATPADREVGLDSPYVVILLPTVDEEAFELTFTHARLAVLHHVTVRLGSDLGGPAHRQDLIVVLYGASLADDVVKGVVVDSQIGQVGLLWNLSLQLRVTVDALVHIHSRVGSSRALSCHVLLQFIDVAYFELILSSEVFLRHHSHPDLVQVVHLGHEKNGFLLNEIDQAIAVHFDDTEHIVKECFLIAWVGDI